MRTHMRIDLSRYSCLTFKGNAFRIPLLIRRQRYLRLQLCRHQAHDMLSYIPSETIPSSAKKIFHERLYPIYPFQIPATFATSTPLGSVLVEDAAGLIVWENWPIDSATAQTHRSQVPKSRFSADRKNDRERGNRGDRQDRAPVGLHRRLRVVLQLPSRVGILEGGGLTAFSLLGFNCLSEIELRRFGAVQGGIDAQELEHICLGLHRYAMGGEEALGRGGAGFSLAFFMISAA